VPTTSTRDTRNRRRLSVLAAFTVATTAALLIGLLATAGNQAGQVLTATSSDTIPAAGQATADACYDPTTTTARIFPRSAITSDLTVTVLGINLFLIDQTNLSVDNCADWDFTIHALDSSGAVLGTSTGTFTTGAPGGVNGFGTDFTGVPFANIDSYSFLVEKGA